MPLNACKRATPVELRRQLCNSAGNHGNSGHGFTPLSWHQSTLISQWKILLYLPTPPVSGREGWEQSKL